MNAIAAYVVSLMGAPAEPRKQRALALPEVINELRPKLSGFPGFRAFLTARLLTEGGSAIVR